MAEFNTPFTKRETEILKLTGNGLKNHKIAELLFISHKTVETHKSNILKKLNLKSTAELYCYIFKNSQLIKMYLGLFQ